MPFDTSDAAALRRVLPNAMVGDVRSIAPIGGGLSGASVYGVTAEKGEYVLRIQPGEVESRLWSEYVLILRRASAARVAPGVVHVDDQMHSVVFIRVAGEPLTTVLRNAAHRESVIADVVARLQTLHAIDPTGTSERDPLAYARDVWDRQRRRTDLPEWLLETQTIFDEITTVLARDTRRVLSHNDANPGNIIWDGTRSWLVDWDVAGLGHPYYDLAAFVTFLGIDREQGHALLALQERSALDDDAHRTFDALRQLVALAIGYSFIGTTPDLTRTAPTLTDAPTQADCRTAMRRGELDLQTAQGRALYGLALLRVGLERFR